MQKLIFSNITGSYVFSSAGEVIDSIGFKDSEEFLKKEDSEKRLLQKHPDAKKPGEKELPMVVAFFKKPTYFPQFSKINLQLSKQAIRDSVSRDSLLIQTSSTIEELDKAINLLTKRLREWYGMYNPETEYHLGDHQRFVNTILMKPKAALLKEFNISDKEAMGADFAKKDLDATMQLAQQIQKLFSLREENEAYLALLEKEICPNLCYIAGSAIAAKLIVHAGSLKRLAQMPASTLQVLGAEKALFRHLRNKGKNLPPKYGLLHEHPLIAKVQRKDHGKAARSLADRLSMAARLDFYKGEFKGEEYKKELVDKFKVQF